MDQKIIFEVRTPNSAFNIILYTRFEFIIKSNTRIKGLIKYHYLIVFSTKVRSIVFKDEEKSTDIIKAAQNHIDNIRRLL